MNQERFTLLHWATGTIALAWLIHLLAPILTPFVAAGIFAYLCNPLVEWLAARHVRRTLATVVVILLLIGLLLSLLLIVLPVLQRELWGFTTRLPMLLDTLRIKLTPFAQQYLHINLQWDSGAIRDLMGSNLQGAGGVAGQVLPWLGGGMAALLGLLVNLVLLPVVLFYLLRDGPAFLPRIEHLIPERLHDTAMRVVSDVNLVLGEFLRGQLIVMLLMSLFYSVGLWLAGLEFALSIGVVTGLLVFIPYIGVATGLVLATLAAFSQFDSFNGMALVWVVFAVGHLLESMLVTPHFVGERIGLHPLAVIFSLLAFGQLFGFFGVLLALPMAAIMLVALRQAREWYLSSNYYKG